MDEELGRLIAENEVLRAENTVLRAVCAAVRGRLVVAAQAARQASRCPRCRAQLAALIAPDGSRCGDQCHGCGATWLDY